MDEPENVNPARLTKLEKKALIALLNFPRRGESPTFTPEGNNAKGIATVIYGAKAFEERSSYLTKSAKASMSRLLNNLWKKGLVLKCKPSYRSFWCNDDWADKGFWMREYTGMCAFHYRAGNEFIAKEELDVWDYGTKVWWRLSNTGRDLIEEITGIKAKREREIIVIKARRERCRGCNCWIEEKDQCDLQRIKEKWKELDECREKNVWEWHDEYGWEYRGVWNA